nr:leucine-rich repeat domain-containing protein [uncultured Anaerostipes sp.]
MRKRVLTYSLAVAMAVAMAVPQTAILPTGIVQVKAADTETEAGLKTGVALTKAEWGQNWSGTENYIKFTEMDKYASASSDYCSKINKVVVNDKEYPAEYDEEEKDNYYSMSYLNGLCIYMGSIKDGENTIIVSANGYKDKKIIVNVDKTAKTITFVSQEDLGSGDAVIDKNALNPTEDGVYTVTLKATKQGSDATSSLGGYFEGKAKLTVKDGEMKLSMLNVSMAKYLLDFTLETDGTFAQATKEAYGDANSDGSYDAYEYTMSIKDLSKIYTAAALVSVMGSESDKGDYDKYMKADITFTSLEKGWKGYDKKDANQTLVDVLIEKGADTNNDGEITKEELAAFAGDGGSLDLSNKNLSNIDLLKGLSDKITELDLSGNKITEIPEGFFDNMTNLEYVDLNSNHIKALPENAFKNTKKLKWINIRANNLTEIKKDTLSGLDKLVYLELDNNSITSVEAGALDGDTSLKQLSISGNELNALPDHLLDDAGDTIDFIELSNNEFVKLPNCINAATKKLRKISAFNNALEDISNIDFTKMSNLEEVNFYKNYIAQVPDGTFAKNKKLYSVDFHDNQISNITEKAFPETFENDYDGVLHKLDLTLNNIKVVDPAVMKKSDTAINKFYPQKNAMNLELKEDNSQKISWSQDLSVLDLAFWFDKTASDEAREIETVEDYKDMLEQNGWKDKNIAEVMDEKYDWDIITEVQKKNADGTWETVKEDTKTDQAEELKGNFSVSDLGTYRVKKVLNATLNGTKQYRFTVYSNELAVSKKDDKKPSTTEQKPSSTTAEQKPSDTTTAQKLSTTTVKDILKKVSKIKLQNLKKRKVRITWKKVKNADGYQVYRATKKNGKYKLVKVVKGNKKVSYTNTKLKKNKKYYYKVRAYRTVKGKKVYGAFSSKKSILIKK